MVNSMIVLLTIAIVVLGSILLRQYHCHQRRVQNRLHEQNRQLRVALSRALLEERRAGLQLVQIILDDLPHREDKWLTEEEYRCLNQVVRNCLNQVDQTDQMVKQLKPSIIRSSDSRANVPSTLQRTPLHERHDL